MKPQHTEQEIQDVIDELVQLGELIVTDINPDGQLVYQTAQDASKAELDKSMRLLRAIGS